MPDIKPKRVVDFRAGYAGRDKLWIAARNLAAVSDIQQALPAFTGWAKSNRYTLRQLPTDQSGSEFYLDNRGAIARDLSANRRYLKPRLLKSEQELLEQPRPIGTI